MIYSRRAIMLEDTYILPTEYDPDNTGLLLRSDDITLKGNVVINPQKGYGK